MVKLAKKVDEYIQFLQQKGFGFGEDAIGFISFGQHYTAASDEIVNIAIEITLKAQKEFDGSFFVSLLERLTENKVINRKEAYKFAEYKKII